MSPIFPPRTLPMRKAALLKARYAAREALRDAYSALAELAPSETDYCYRQAAALKQHNQRMAQLLNLMQEVIDEIRWIGP